MPGRVHIAAGGQHLSLVRQGTSVVTVATDDPPENSCRPAVDVLFRSVAALYGSSALAVVLTGMGQDGLRGAEAIRVAGGQILTQDEATSVVWGMPGFVAQAGLADAVLPLDALAAEIDRRVAVGRLVFAIGTGRMTTTFTDAEFTYIRDMVRTRSAIVLEPGKEYLVEARLAPLVRELGLGSIGAPGGQAAPARRRVAGRPGHRGHDHQRDVVRQLPTLTRRNEVGERIDV